ncbi:MAG: hypothetical protein EXR69_08720 [Myxococcales bacterium]|nr:hypothetical protein [Myxococcales bacterium]
MPNDPPNYDDRSVRQFIVATVLWGCVGMLVAVAVALAGWMNPLLAAVAMPVSSAVAVWGVRRVAA